jgi:hypothetical protein
MSLDSLSFASMSLSSSIYVMTADSTPMPLTSVGSIIKLHLSLLNVYLILKLILNITYIGQLCDSNNYLVIFSSFFVVVCKIYNLKSWLGQTIGI